MAARYLPYPSILHILDGRGCMCHVVCASHVILGFKEGVVILNSFLIII